jgi:hypothetical protein
MGTLASERTPRAERLVGRPRVDWAGEDTVQS